MYEEKREDILFTRAAVEVTAISVLPYPSLDAYRPTRPK